MREIESVKTDFDGDTFPDNTIKADQFNRAINRFFHSRGMRTGWRKLNRDQVRRAQQELKDQEDSR